jgi:hypothetical protein
MSADLFKRYLTQLNLGSLETPKLFIQLLTDYAMEVMNILPVLILTFILMLKLKLIRLTEIKENGLKWPLWESLNQVSFHLIEL